MDICSLVGTNIRKARQAKEWPQEELSHRSGVDRAYLSLVESGKKNIGIKRIEALARALEIDVKDLFDGYIK